MRLIELDSNLKKALQEVQIENYTNDGKLNLQGIAYDTIDDAIWIAVGDSIQEISKRGKLTKVIDLGKYKNIRRMVFVWIMRIIRFGYCAITNICFILTGRKSTKIIFCKYERSGYDLYV